MKTIIGIFAFLVSFTAMAQNQNTSTVTKTTTTTIKDGKNEKKIVKQEEVQENQAIELKDTKPGTKNMEVKETPTQVTSTTRIIEDGVQKLVSVDHSAYYTYNGEKYQIKSDLSGYSMTSPNSNKLSLLRRTSNGNYIYKNNNKFSVGYFDNDGNLILETYDEKTDKVTVEKFNLQK